MANEEIKPLKVVDYIDRFEVLELLGNKIDLFSESPMDNDDFTKLKLAIEIELEVRRLSTLDVVEVKHGGWIDDGFGRGNMICSVCEQYPVDDEDGNPLSALADWEPPICPNCGAKMDGGKAK